MKTPSDRLRRLYGLRRRLDVEIAAAERLEGIVCDDVTHEVCRLYEITFDDLIGRRRSAWIVAARRTTCVALSLLGWSSVRIGRQLGRDHTTILHALATATDDERDRAARLVADQQQQQRRRVSA